MKVVVQRVACAHVLVEDDCVGKISRGLLLLVGVEKGDTEREAEFLAEKIIHLRIFGDDNGKMNLSVLDIRGEILSISQFTLAGDIRRGRRPDFTQAEEPLKAKELYCYFNSLLQKKVVVETGVFGAMMEVHLVNDGPVTLIMEKKSDSPAQQP